MKTIRVEEVYRLHNASTASIPEDVSLEYVIDRFACEPGIRGFFLVDSGKRLSGMLTRDDLMRWAYIQFFDQRSGHNVTISDFFRIADAKKAKDLATSAPLSIAVKESDTVQDALEKMLRFQEDVLPVIDSESRILGDIRLSEIMLKAIEIGKQTNGKV